MPTLWFMASMREFEIVETTPQPPEPPPDIGVGGGRPAGGGGGGGGGAAPLPRGGAGPPTPRRSRVIRFTAPIRVQCWRSRLTLNLVAADVSPLHLKSVESVSRLRSAATVEGFRARILRGILTRRAASLTYPFGPPSPIQWARDDVLTGGGWVNDSTPEGEFPETVNKSKAMLKAVALAESFAREA